MRNTATFTVALVAFLFVTSSVHAQPAPFPPTLDLTITYDNFPSASGVYTFAFDPVLYYYVHDGLPDTFGTIDWSGPFTPQTTAGSFVHALHGAQVRFTGTWFADGFLVTSVLYPNVTITGTRVPEPSALALLLPMLASPLLRRRRLRA